MSTGSYEYVMDDHAALRPRGEVALSECDFGEGRLKAPRKLLRREPEQG
jgi:hypothetical protein